MCLVSIIIPIYNGAFYVAKGVESIINQTYKNIEIIFVNDGSYDNSEQILKNIIETNKECGMTFVYCSQENAGIAMARNKGLECCNGKYIMFMDQDDWLEADCVETLVHEIESTNLDLIIGGFKLVYENGKVKEKWELDENEQWSKYRITAPWGRIFRKSVIDTNNLKFMNTKISEDLYFNLLYMSTTSKVKVVSYVGYNWLYNVKSESRAKWNKISEDRNPLHMLDELQKSIKVSDRLEYDLVRYFHVKYIVWYLLYSARKSAPKLVKETYRNCIQWLNLNYPSWNKEVGVKNPGKEKQTTHFTVVCCIFLYRIKLLYPFLRLWGELR